MAAFSMEIFGFFLVALSTLLWVGFALLPWRPWSNLEVVDVMDGDKDGAILGEITVVIPARNEAKVIRQTLRSVIEQGPGLKIVLVDDHSEDATVQRTREMRLADLRVLHSPPLPAGWSGKLWALEQGRQQVTTPYMLLLDADIKLARGIVRTLRERMHQQGVSFISLMARPSMSGRWEKFLMPAFVYFFKVLYPFGRVNLHHTKMAAAAGGCILVETRLLDEIGAFQSIKSAVIDDCALARQVKSRGFKIWLGLTHSVNSIRSYQRLGEIWDMVARTAFVQLRCSVGLLVLCTLVMVLAYEVPVVMVFSSSPLLRYFCLLSLGIMFSTYIPILRFYNRSWAWTLGLPLIAALFLAMTWTSAIRYWRGEHTRWKGRVYQRQAAAIEFSEDQAHRSEP
ncbi:MAG TPA: glycosyltransferase [Candidatus Binatia bacterium]|nr:glycosyltransferase [Candidatus Binatia bacterium]